ncbi:MAG: hypothetical protein AB1697_10550 [Pseudomonadota bacterium]
MKWQFEEFPKSLVETEVTQRDQFRNDEVDLADTLIRETVQNSLDARAGNGAAVTVRFAFPGGDSAPDPSYIKLLFQGHLEHAAAAGLAVDNIDLDHPRAIVVEDFGTRGLQGNPWVKGNDDFNDFWRRHGISHKSGDRRGRWGLGKLVFSTSSLLRAFFGLTVPADSKSPLLMGQTVLSMHELDGRQYPAHTHFSEVLTSNEQAGLRVPITDPEFLARFSKEFRLKRSSEPGLSLAIPFPHPDLERTRMIAAAIRHYFIPILRGQLVIEFDELVLNSDSLRECAHQYLPTGAIHDVDELFAFVREADTTPDLVSLGERWHRDGLEQAIQPEALETMRQSFAGGALVGVRFPIDIVRKDGTTVSTEVRGFLKKPSGLSRGQDHYVRSGITVPQESKFGHRNALGLLLADDAVISEFLGDAENPAHTLWIGNAEKVQKNYKGAKDRVAAIKKCLQNLHDLLAQAVEEKAEEALLDFFWTPGMGVGPRRDKGKETFPPAQPPTPEPKPFRISAAPGGFTVRPGAALATNQLPLEATIKAAYDVDEGNPFRLWSELDFDFAKPGDAEIVVKGAEAIGTGNTIRCTVLEPGFEITVTGLDERRDLIVKVEAV